MVYVAVLLDEPSRRRLARRFPPKHFTILYHHVTLCFQPSPTDLLDFVPWWGRQITLEVVGRVLTPDLQVVTVRLPSSLCPLCRSRIPHITLSCDVPPVRSNLVLVTNPILSIRPRVFLRGIVVLIDS